MSKDLTTVDEVIAALGGQLGGLMRASVLFRCIRLARTRRANASGLAMAVWSSPALPVWVGVLAVLGALVAMLPLSWRARALLLPLCLPLVWLPPAWRLARALSRALVLRRPRPRAPRRGPPRSRRSGLPRPSPRLRLPGSHRPLRSGARRRRRRARRLAPAPRAPAQGRRARSRPQPPTQSAAR